MTPYKSTSGKAYGVVSYEIGNDFIKVRFLNARTYHYPVSLNGQAIISKMKSLAMASRGLSTFIARNKSRLKYT